MPQKHIRICASVALVLLTSLQLCASWWWPFGKKEDTPIEPAPPAHGRFIPTDGDQSKKVYPKKDDKNDISVERVIELAEGGNPVAQLNLGKIYVNSTSATDAQMRICF